MTPQGRLHSLPQLVLTSPSRQDILDYFDNSWTLTELLFSALRTPEAYTRPPVHGLRHPMIFYYGHVAVLYVNKLRLAGLCSDPVDEELEQYLEVGVDEMSWDDLSKNEKKWPTVGRVQAYRRKVYHLVKTLIETHSAFDSARAPFLEQTPAWALALAFEHERIHLETSSVLIRELPLSLVRRPEAWPDDFPSPKAGTEVRPLPTWTPIAAGTTRFGKARSEPSFGWDNEYGERVVEVPAFETTSSLITNHEFERFIAAGGYREQRYWSEEGWRWKLFRNAKWPTFWVPNGPSAVSGFKLRRLFELSDLEPTWPAIVNFYEAEAYGRWLAESDGAPHSYRLTTEAEQHRIRDSVGPVAAMNSNLVYGSESAVTAHVQNGIGDVFGNVWQWCEDHANPLPGFSPHPYYEDFSTPCFDGKHQMILGGSFVSTGDEAGAWARFHFRPHFFQHAGFRLVKGLAGRKLAVKINASESPASGVLRYEDTALVSSYLELHYGEKDQDPFITNHMPDALGFPRRCAEKVIHAARRRHVPMARALDLGCAVGGASFALSREFQSVTGVDISAAFIQHAERLKSLGKLAYERAMESPRTETRWAEVPDGTDRSRVTFHQGDAMALPAEWSPFDAVLMANLLCRLPRPKEALLSLATSDRVLKKSGLLVLASPYSWLKEFTPEKDWLGGASQIRALLSPFFDLVEEDEVPLLIREHARKYQYIVSHLTVWQKR